MPEVDYQAIMERQLAHLRNLKTGDIHDRASWAGILDNFLNHSGPIDPGLLKKITNQVHTFFIEQAKGNVTKSLAELEDEDA